MVSMFPFFLSVGGESLLEKLTVWYRSSVLYEILNYLRDRYFTVEFGAYENFNLGSGASSMAQTIILSVAIGFIVAAVMAVYTRTVLGKFVRALLKSEAKDAQSAKDLASLGFFRSTSIRRELSRGVTLRKVVKCVQEEEFLKEKSPENTLENLSEDQQEASLENANGEGESKKVESTAEQRFKPDFTTARYYIPEELRYRAELRFEQKGSGWGPLLITILASLVIAALLSYLLPDILQLADNLISVMSPKA